MSDIVIKAENLGKSYIIGHEKREQYTALRDVMVNRVKQIAGKTRQIFKGGQLIAGNELEEFWALKDLNFEIKQGDRVGIIGRNGAGKSTLLKVLSRITEPTTGRVQIKGRVASLLEVGTGFHPELTGRENIYLNGAILGMSRIEIKKKFDEIVDFSGIEKFLDTPVKRYSSGMYVRLAFSVAAHLEPEILMIDEVLAVGDFQFQQKCLGKMEDVSKNGGRTIFFVSHNLQAVISLCEKSLLLNQGKLISFDTTNTVINQYLNLNSNNSISEIFWNEGNCPGNDLVKLKSLRIINSKNEPVREISLTKEFFIEIMYENYLNDTEINLSVSVYAKNGEYVLSSPSITDTKWFRKPHPIGKFKSICKIPGNLLNEGFYSFTILAIVGNSTVVNLEKILLIEMVDDTNRNETNIYWDWMGVVRPTLQWETEKIS